MRRRLVGAGRDDAGVQIVDQVGGRRRRTGGHLQDARQPVLLVARVDAFRTVAGVEILVQHETRALLDDRDAELFGGTRINRRLEDDDIALADQSAEQLAGCAQRAEQGPVARPDRRRHGHDVHVASTERFGIGAETQFVGGRQGLRLDLERRIPAVAERFDPLLAQVIANGRVLATRRARYPLLSLGDGRGQSANAKPREGR